MRKPCVWLLLAAVCCTYLSPASSAALWNLTSLLDIVLESHNSINFLKLLFFYLQLPSFQLIVSPIRFLSHFLLVVRVEVAPLKPLGSLRKPIRLHITPNTATNQSAEISPRSQEAESSG